MQKSRTLISSMLAFSVALTGVLVMAGQNSANAVSKDGFAAIKDDAQTFRRQAMEYFASGNDARCLEFYQKAIDQAIKDAGPNSSYVSDLYFEMGCAAKQRAKFSTAEHCFSEALKHRPNSIPARLQLASVYNSEGKRAEAFAQIKAAKVKNPHSPQAQGALVAYIQGMNRPAEAAHEASLIRSMLPSDGKNSASNTAPGVSHFNGLTDLKAPTSEPPAKTALEKKEPKETKKPEAELKETKQPEVKSNAQVAPAENPTPSSLGAGSVLRGLRHGTTNNPQPANAPIVTPVAPPPAAPAPAPAPAKMDDKELELAKAKAQLEMMRKKLEAAEQSKASKDKHPAHEQAKPADNHKKHSDNENKKTKHPPKPVEDTGTNVGGREAVLQTKAVIEKKKGNAFGRVQSGVSSEKSSGESSHSDSGDENKPKEVKHSSDLRFVPPNEGERPAQYIQVQGIPSASAPASTKKHRSNSMVPPPPPTPVFGGGMPIMQPPPVMQAPKAQTPKKHPTPKKVEEESSGGGSSKSSEEDTNYLLDWGGASEKHKHK